MIIPNDPIDTTPTSQEQPGKARFAVTQERKRLPVQPALPSKPNFLVRRRRLLSLLGVLLIIPLIAILAHVSALFLPDNNQVLVRLGSQGTALVDLRQSLPISPYLLGVNVFPAENTSSVDQENSGFMSYSSPIASGLKNADIKLLRFPGGTWGEDHLLSYDQLNSFSTLLSQVGAEGMIQARLSGWDGPKGPSLATLAERANLAGEWVDYVNNPKSRLRTGQYANAPFHPVKLWTVGNEPDLTLNPDTHKAFTVEEYVQTFIRFSVAMHQNNPTIQVFGPEISQFYGLGTGPTDLDGQPWMESFLQGVAAYEQAHPELPFHLLDGVSFHYYPLADTSKDPSDLLSGTADWSYLLPPLRHLIQQDFHRDMPIGVTEINSNPIKKAPAPGIAALWWADTLAALMNQEVAYVAFFSAEGVDVNYPLFTTNGFHPTPMLRAMQLFSHLQPNRIPIAAPRDPISVYAAQNDTHQVVSLLFVNKSSTTQLVQVSGQNTFFGLSPWNEQDITLQGYSITLVTLHRGGVADAYSFAAANADEATIAPLQHTVCGHKTDLLATNLPC